MSYGEDPNAHKEMWDRFTQSATVIGGAIAVLLILMALTLL